MKTFVEEALKQAKETLKVYEENAKESASSLRFLIKRMEGARRIRLVEPLIPEGGGFQAIGLVGMFAQGIAHPLDTDLIIEYEHGGLYDVEIDPTCALSTRRMVLVVPMETEWAVTLEGAPPRPVDPSDRGALLMWSINYFEEKLEWEFAPSAIILPKAQAFECLSWRRSWISRISRSWREKVNGLLKTLMPNMSTGGGGAVDHPIQVLYQDMIPEIIRQLDQDSIQRITRDMSMDACWAALATLNAISCANVRIGDIPGEGGAGQTLLRCQGAPGAKAVYDIAVNPFLGRIENDWLGLPVWRHGRSSLCVEPIKRDRCASMSTHTPVMS